MKKKKKVNAVKIISFIAGVVTALAAIAAVLMMLKKKAAEDKKREAEIEAEITEIIERKFAEAADEKDKRTDEEA